MDNFITLYSYLSRHSSWITVSLVSNFLSKHSHNMCFVKGDKEILRKVLTSEVTLPVLLQLQGATREDTMNTLSF